ncbi:uncharacterized protein Bfra_004541 [Botrytis fragariae]|uniref:Uncharacterized protein n=1 Tax=Botrytis fragariae TaxID=1964551 RepID=A0A8H6EJV3_9HELO|nr:uncharacterized protein Bfra_004541 [Botrytis fragariae]KAF5874530.1 hypothetical protein Bfra_004541 [Botrytis fragariae]
MAKKSKNSIPNPPRSISDDSSNDDGAPVYTPPETESNDSPSTSAHVPDPNHLHDVIIELQNVNLAQEEAYQLGQEVDKKDISTNKKNKKSGSGNRSSGKKPVAADTAVSNVTDSLQKLAVSDKDTNNLESEKIDTKAAKSRKRKERKKRRKARLAEEEEQTQGGISNYKWFKSAGWKDMKDFMTGHGFKWGDVDDYAAASELIKRLKEDQASEEYAEPEPPKKEVIKDASVKVKTAKTKKKTVVGLWADYFGNETELANWQRLCIDVGLEEIPTSITKCRKALGKVWVNIYDFLDAKAEGTTVKRYQSERELAKYTLKSGKVYPKSKAKEGGPVRALLAHIFGR